MLFSAAPLEITELWPHLRPQQILFAGRLTDPLRHSAAVHGLTLYDYYDREELAIANALPTAEGAVQIAMEELSTTIEGTRSLVLGFGRIGKILARKLDALGSDVSVAARGYTNRAWIEALGYRPAEFDQLPGQIGEYDLVINTVPARILTEAELRHLDPNCVCIDLASAPGGAGA